MPLKASSFDPMLSLFGLPKTPKNQQLMAEIMSELSMLEPMSPTTAKGAGKVGGKLVKRLAREAAKKQKREVLRTSRAYLSPVPKEMPEPLLEYFARHGFNLKDYPKFLKAKNITPEQKLKILLSRGVDNTSKMAEKFPDLNVLTKASKKVSDDYPARRSIKDPDFIINLITTLVSGGRGKDFDRD